MSNRNAFKLNMATKAVLVAAATGALDRDPGLKLEPQKGVVEMLIIDSVGHPSVN